RPGSKGGSQSDVCHEDGAGGEKTLSKSKTSVHSVNPSIDESIHSDPWAAWQIEAQRLRLEQEATRVEQDRIRREELERFRLEQEARDKQWQRALEQKEERLRILKEEKEERRHKEKLEAEEKWRLAEEKR